MSGQFTSRDILAFSMYEDLQVSKYLNGFYDYLFLGEYDRNIQGSNTITSEFNDMKVNLKKLVKKAHLN